MPTQDHLDIPRRRPLGGIIVTAAAVIVVFAALTVGLAFLLRGEPAEAPDLRGLNLEEAAAVAEAAGLAVLPRDDAEAATPTALVVAQDPPPGTQMRAGELVWVDLAEPPALVTVPDVIGMTSGDARALFESSGLRLGALREDLGSTAPVGVVTRQELEPGVQTPAGTSVSVWVAGPPTVVVPDLSGLDRQEAEAAAASAGLSVRFLAEVTDEVLTGLVFRQSPQAGTRVGPGSQIVAVVNGGVSERGPGGSGATVVDVDATPPPAVFSALAKTYTFSVLYPGTLPAGLVLRTGPDNPGHRTGAAGTQGFEVAYSGSEDSAVSLSLLEGDWFDPGLEGATMVDIRGLVAYLVVEGDLTILAWKENGTRYALSSIGIAASEVLTMAAGLRATPSQ